MGLLKLVEQDGIDYQEYRDNLYYNKYIYKARFYIVGARYTWYAKSSAHFIKDFYNRNFYLLKNQTKKEMEDNMHRICAFIDWKIKVKKLKVCSFRIEGHHVFVYSNDLDFLKNLPNDIPDIDLEYTQAITSGYVGVKHFSNQPKHKFRVYLKSKRVEHEFANNLKNLFKKNKELYPSPALKFWANEASYNMTNWKYRWSSASHFIDYDNESTLSYLALMHGDMLGKRYKLEKRPEDV